MAFAARWTERLMPSSPTPSQMTRSSISISMETLRAFLKQLPRKRVVVDLPAACECCGVTGHRELRGDLQPLHVLDCQRLSQGSNVFRNSVALSIHATQ